MFGCLSLGLEIRPEGLSAVALRRWGRKTTLLGEQHLPLAPGVAAVSASQPNLLQPEEFVNAVRTVLAPLAQGETRVALALPNAAGHVLLLDQELPFKSRSHGLKVLRWQLKDVLPHDPEQVSLEFQSLAEWQGARKVLVSVLHRQVLDQYENLLQQAGYKAALVDFQAMQQYSWYRSRVDLMQDYLLLGLCGEQLSLLVIRGRVLNFCRVRTVDRQPEKVFNEINRSLVAYRRDHPELARFKVYLHADWQDAETLAETIQSCFEQPVQILPAAPAAALGAAERML